MDLHQINGPQDYNKFYHTSSEDLVQLDGKGNLIPLSYMVGAHVEAINPTELWNLIQTRGKSTDKILQPLAMALPTVQV